MLSSPRILELLAALLFIIVASLSSIAVKSYLARAAQEPVAAGAPYGDTAVISDVTVTDVTSMTAVVSWQTSPATVSCLNLDSAIHSVFTIFVSQKNR